MPHAVSGVVVAFSIIGVIILAGYISAWRGLVLIEHVSLLNKLNFYVFTPALLFAVLAKTSVDTIFSPVLLILLISSAAIVALFVVLSRIFFRRDLAATTIGATASVYLNSNNIGLPVSMFVLGDLTYFAPVIVLQLVLFLPIVLVFLELGKSGQPSILRSLRQVIINPLVISSALGIAVAITGFSLPAFVFEPFATMGAAAVPVLLFTYGVSLRGQELFDAQGDRPFAFTAIVLKSVLLPTIAFILSKWVFQLSSHEIYAAVILAALPTAQNVFTYASVYNAKMFAIRDVVFATTVASIPALFIITALLKA